MTEHVHTADCFVEGTQVCGMELRARPPITPAAAVELARHSRQLTTIPPLNTPEVLMSGTDLLKFLELATADRRRYSPIPRQVQRRGPVRASRQLPSYVGPRCASGSPSS